MCTAVRVIKFVVWPYSWSFALIFYLFSSPMQQGIPRYRSRKKRRENKTKQGRMAWTMPYKEIVKSGTIRLISSGWGAPLYCTLSSSWFRLTSSEWLWPRAVISVSTTSYIEIIRYSLWGLTSGQHNTVPSIQYSTDKEKLSDTVLFWGAWLQVGTVQ